MLTFKPVYEGTLTTPPRTILGDAVNKVPIYNAEQTRSLMTRRVDQLRELGLGAAANIIEKDAAAPTTAKSILIPAIIAVVLIIGLMYYLAKNKTI